MKRIKVTITIIKEYRKRTAKKICPVVMKYGFGKIEVKRTPFAITTTEYINASSQHPDEIIFNSENEFSKFTKRVKEVNSTLLSSFRQVKTNTINF